MAARKLWSTTRGPESPAIEEMYRKRYPSQAAAYQRVRHEAQVGFEPRDHVDVWVDERDGHGWQHYERVQLADLAAMGE
jgi:hypothetical protein